MIKTDVLTKFNRKKKSFMSPKHPLFFEETEHKISYCAGIFAQAALNKSSSTLNNYELERLMVKGLGLEPKEIALIIRKVTEEERITDTLLLNIVDPLEQYLYLMDLLNVSLRKEEMSIEEKEAINKYRVLFHVSEEIFGILAAFIQAAYQSDIDQCLMNFAKMQQLGLPLTMTELKYYMPDMEFITQIEDKSIIPGKETRIVDACTIKDKLIIPKDSILVLDHAVINLNGTIVVDGGTLIIRDTTIVNKAEVSNSLIEVKSYSDVVIENSVIDCRYVGSAINQKNGKLSIKNTKVYHTTRNSAIKFWGDQIEVNTCSFRKCYTVENGAAIQIQQGKGNVTNSTFVECEAKNGGAIFVGTQIMVTCCSFRRCCALEHGGAIYYNNEVKSNVLDCQYFDCSPEGEELIQYLHGTDEKVVEKEYSIRIPTILDIPIRVTELGILNIDHTVLYLRQGVQCRGILEIKGARIIADNLVQRDIFDICRSRGCVIDQSEFDGKGMNSAFRATGSRMIVRHSMFRNIKNGRAIYDAMEPKITNSVFSYCQDGAIYSCAGEIRNCLFINCRQKSGAGIMMYGSRGIITDSRFVRCVSEYSGGAIDKSGGHRINQCEFKECKPDNIG